MAQRYTQYGKEVYTVWHRGTHSMAKRYTQYGTEVHTVWQICTHNMASWHMTRIMH